MKYWKMLIDSQYKVKVFALFIFVTGAFTFLFGFQNCGKVKFSTGGVEGINNTCNFNGAQIVLNPDTNLNSATSVNFSISPALDPGTTVQWTFQVQGGQASAPINTTTVDKTFGDGTYIVNALLTKSGPCTTNLTASFTISDTVTCTQPTGIGGPTHGFVGDLQTFQINNVNVACFTGAAQWEMDQEINGVVNTNPHAINNANPTATASYTYTSPGTYQVQVQVPNETYTATHDIVICSANQIFQNGQCVTVCVDPTTQQQVAVGSTAQGYAATTGTCANLCKQITATCQASGQFSPAIYATCTNPTTCGGGNTCTNGALNSSYPLCNVCASGYTYVNSQCVPDFVQAQISAYGTDFTFSHPTSTIAVVETTYSYVKVRSGVRDFKLCFDLDINCNGHVTTCNSQSDYTPVHAACTGNSCALQGTSGVTAILHTDISGFDIFEVTNTANPPNGTIGGPNCHATTHVQQNTASAQFSYVEEPAPTFSCTKSVYQCGDTVICSASSFDNTLTGCDPSGCYPLQGRANWTYNGNGQFSYSFANTPQNQLNTADAIQHWNTKDIFGQVSPMSVVNIKPCGTSNPPPSTCTNGALNSSAPACNVCPTGYTYSGGVCNPNTPPPTGDGAWDCYDGLAATCCSGQVNPDGSEILCIIDDAHLNPSGSKDAYIKYTPNHLNGADNENCACHTGKRVKVRDDCSTIQRYYICQ